MSCRSTTLVDLLILAMESVSQCRKEMFFPPMQERGRVMEDGPGLVRKRQPDQCRTLQICVPKHAVHEAC